jgi:hypothetical protein
MTSNRRAIRNAAIDNAAELHGPFTIIDTVTLPSDTPKFVAWISGARGRNGFTLLDANGVERTAGLTLVNDFDARGAITNIDYLTVTTDETDGYDVAHAAAVTYGADAQDAESDAYYASLDVESGEDSYLGGEDHNGDVIV